MIARRMALLCAWIVGTVLLIAAFTKIGDWKTFGHSLEAVPFLPRWGAAFLLFWIPSLELTLGLCLLAGVYRYEASVLSLLLFAVFTGWLIYAALHPEIHATGTGCGCMKLTVIPQVADLSGWKAVGRNILLLGMCAALLFAGNKTKRIE